MVATEELRPLLAGSDDRNTMHPSELEHSLRCVRYVSEVLKIGEEGTVTFSMPDLVGQYLVVEEIDGQIILSPFDLRWNTPSCSIAKFGKKLHYVPSSNDSIPEA